MNINASTQAMGLEPFWPSDSGVVEEDGVVHTVNLDALIPREDFEAETAEGADTSANRPGSELYLSLLTPEGQLASLRKPSFQRETSAWKPEIVVSFIKSVVDGDVIPAIIMWKSPRSGTLFVIDGAHRLSALVAWILDDYGDRAKSLIFYNHQINEEQINSAKITREMVEKQVGSYGRLRTYAANPDAAPDDGAIRRSRRIATDPIYLQWIVGDAKAAEASFIRINSTAVAIDDTEKFLIASRRRPDGLSARAIMRAGTGHEYWSKFDDIAKNEIKAISADIYRQLIKPIVDYPVITLDLPADNRGYSASSIKNIVDLVNYANPRPANKKVFTGDASEDDIDGSKTISYLKNVRKITDRVFGRHPGSLALHPGIYCYGKNGKFIPGAFIAAVGFVSALEKSGRFFDFTAKREKFEEFILGHREYVSSIGKAQGSGGGRGVPALVKLYESIFKHIADGIDDTGIENAIISDPAFKFLKSLPSSGHENTSTRFRKEDKAAVILKDTLDREMICPICRARLYRKVTSNDHKVRIIDGGTSSQSNLQLTHPYCNTGYKEAIIHRKHKADVISST